MHVMFHSGVTLVVSPLVSLMEDQLFALRRFGVDASLLCASSTKDDVNRVQQAMTDKQASLKILYVTPEKLAKSKRCVQSFSNAWCNTDGTRFIVLQVHEQAGEDVRSGSVRSAGHRRGALLLAMGPRLPA